MSRHLASVLIIALGLPAAALAQSTGTIAGTITATSDGNPIAFANVQVFNFQRKFVSSSTTNTSGTYSISIATGSYYIRVTASGFVSQLYTGIPCVAADCFSGTYLGLTGTAVTVSSGATTTVNVALDKGGTIAGTVTRASDGSAVSGIQVLLYNSSSSQVAAVLTSSTGAYSVNALPPGTYYAQTSGASSLGVLDQVYQGLSCTPSGPCRVDLGTPIVLTMNAPSATVSFSLVAAVWGQLNGRVTFASTGQPVGGGGVTLYSGSKRVSDATVLSTGFYSFTNVQPGTYYLLAAGPATDSFGSWIDQWYGGVCFVCGGHSQGTPVVVTAGATTSGIDFSVDGSTGSIIGTITLPGLDANVNIPSVNVYNADGTLVRTWIGGTQSNVPSSPTMLWSVRGLPAGMYYVRTSSRVAGFQLGFRPEFISPTGGYWIDQLFDNIVCVAADCLPTRGTPVVVTAGQATSNVNFVLTRGARISGKTPGWFFGATRLDVVDSRGVVLPNRADFDQNLGYVAEGLPAGNYFLRLHRPALGVDVLYKDIPCDGCALTTGTPIPVAVGDDKTGIDFSLLNGQAISGTVTSSSPAGQPLSTITIEAYTPNGDFVASTQSLADGSYHLDGGGSIAVFAPGQYYLRTANQRGYADVLYGNSPCSACDPLQATAVTVVAGSDTTGIDFTLSPGAVTVSGTVVDGSAVPIPGVTVRLYASMAAQPTADATTDTFGRYSASLTAGSYFAQTDPFPRYQQQIYKSVACPQGVCPTASATPVVVSSTGVSGIDFALAACTPASIAPLQLANAAVGASYRQTLVATGGSGTKRFVVASGDLPPGLSLDPATGVISGTPTAGGTYSFTIGVADDTGCANTRAYTLDVPACVFTNIGTVTVPAAGRSDLLGFGSVCGPLPVAVSDVPWIGASISTFDHPTPFGVYHLVFLAITVQPNTTSAARTGHVTAGPRVVLVVQSGTVPSAPFGVVDTPATGAVVSGSMAVSGWALDDLGVNRVSIFRDPVAGEGTAQIFIGDATFVDGARPDVEAAYPGLPFNRRAGWGYLMLTNMLPNRGNGVFNIYVYAEDNDANRVLIGVRTITAVNSTATAPFGAIDTPGQGATVVGTVINFGWALTPQPKMIPFDGSTVNVVIDGVPVGPVAAYNLFRSDVSALFPGLKNSGGPVGYRVIDTTALSEGLHTIAWTATDDGGITTGIGSRYFTVQNSAWTPSLVAGSLRVQPPAFTAAEIGLADSTTAIPPRVDGIDLGRKTASLATLPLDADGARTIEMTKLQRLELTLSSGAEVCAATYDGYLNANGELRALPVGSSLDRAGTFYWQPGPAFAGTYSLLFMRTACDGSVARIPVTVEVR